MKKLIVLLLVVLIGISSVFASNLHFVFGDMAQHPDILYGFFPSYALLGVGYDLPQIIEGNNTELRVLVGEGYSQRLMWLDEESGENNFDNGSWKSEDALRFNVWINELSLRFLQGFLKSPVENKDLLTLTLFLNGRYEKYNSGSSFGPFNIKGNLTSIVSDDYNKKIYPELNGKDKALLGLEFALSLKLDLMEDTLHTNDGLWARVDYKLGPKALNSTLSGYSDYSSLTFNVVGAKTLYNLKEGNKSMFSISLVDRFNFNYTTGSAIPSYVIGPVSLGRKVRGFNTYTYQTEFTTVNNLDLRFVGPDVGMDKVAPRLNLFVDVGYGWGNVFNTSRSEENFLASVGAQLEMSFFDFIDLGYEVNYLLVDREKYTQRGRITTNVTFFLDF